MSGTLKQAQRRSDRNNDAEENSFEVNGSKLQLITPEPTHEDILLELAKKRTCDLKLPEKTQQLIAPCVKERKSIIDQAKRISSDAIAEKIAEAIPIEIPKTKYNGPQVAKLIFTIHAALKGCVTAASRPARVITNVFEPLDHAIKVAISNYQNDHQAKMSNVFPTLTLLQKERRYCVGGFLPTDKAHRICIGCNHEFVDEPDTNKGLDERMACC
jgi:hypothetical protein